jgi:hypothetical protein
MKQFSHAGMFIGGLVTALVITGGGVAVAGNGNPLLLGKTNKATKITELKNGGSPLKLTSKQGKAPLVVNSGAKVANLNADKLDGVDSTGFLRSSAASTFLPVGGKAADADKLDGVSSESFALASGQTADVSTVATFQDADGDGTSDSLFAQAVCPAGTKLTGGGEENVSSGFTVVSIPSSNSWVVASTADPAVDLVTDVVAHAVCYNPRGTVAGGTPQGFKASSGVSIAELKAKVAKVLQR